MRITVAHARGDRPWKSQWPIRAVEYFRPLHKFIGVKSVRKIETGLERGQRLSRKLRNTVLMHSIRRGNPPRKSSSPIRGAECFRPLNKIIGFKSVWKIETLLWASAVTICEPWPWLWFATFSCMHGNSSLGFPKMRLHYKNECSIVRIHMYIIHISNISHDDYIIVIS